MSNPRPAATFRHSLGIVSLLCLVALLQGATAQADATFSTPTNLSLTIQDSSDQQVASSGSNVYVVWRDNPSTTVFNPEILFARSIDGGKTFAAWENLSATPSTSSAPWVAASGPHVYVIWSESSSGADGYYLRYSNDSGVTFGAPRNLTTLFGVPPFGNCAMAAAGNNVLLSCTQSIGGTNEIVVARSNDNGTTFSAPQNVSLSPSIGSAKSRIAASGSNVYVAWEEGVGSASEIFLARSSDSGVSFGTPTNVSATAAFSSISVSLDADGPNLWIVWSDRSLGNDELFYRHSLDSGETFSASDNLSLTPSGSSTPFVKGKGSQVWVAWADAPTGNPTSNVPDIYARGSSDGGTSFGETVNISSSATLNSNQPRIGLTDLAVSLIWGEPGSFRDVYHSYLELAIPVPPPSMLSLSPGAAMQTQSVDVDLTGSGFQSGATLALSGTGVTVTDVQFVSATEMKAKMNVSLTATPGGRDLSVTNPDGQSATLSGAFTVMSASALMLIEITRTDVNMGAENGGVLAASSDSSNSSYKSLLSHLANAEKALLRQPADLATAINQMDTFYIKIGNLAKGKKPEITAALYTTLYTDYALVMGSLGGTVKPAQ